MENALTTNIRHVAAPLEINQIKEFFENKELFFVVSYQESKIKGNMLLTYLSNLDLPFEIDLRNTDKNEKFELIKNYMETRNINNSGVLKTAVAQIILEFKGLDFNEVLEMGVLNREECKEFCEKYAELLKKWNLFLTSTLVYFLTSVKELEEKYNFKTSFKEVDDAHFIGTNVVQMFSVPYFMEAFFSCPNDAEVCYFPHQFEEYMFKGKNLFNYFFCPENTLLLIFSSVLSGETTMEKVQEILTKA